MITCALEISQDSLNKINESLRFENKNDPFFAIDFILKLKSAFLQNFVDLSCLIMFNLTILNVGKNLLVS